MHGRLSADSLALIRTLCLVYKQRTNLALALLKPQFKAHARVETSLGTMEIVEQTVSQLKHKFSGGDPHDLANAHLASAHRYLDHGNHSMDADQNPDAGEKKHGDASATDFGWLTNTHIHINTYPRADIPTSPYVQPQAQTLVRF